MDANEKRKHARNILEQMSIAKAALEIAETEVMNAAIAFAKLDAEHFGGSIQMLVATCEGFQNVIDAIERNNAIISEDL